MTNQPRLQEFEALLSRKGTPRKDVLQMLFKSPDPEGDMADVLAKYPSVAKSVLEGWYSPDLSRLSRVANAVSDDAKCKAIAAEALAFVESHGAQQEPRMVPPFNGFRTLRKMGASFDRNPSAEEPRWQDRIEWPSSSFEFSVPKTSKSVLTFGSDPEKDTIVDFHGTKLRAVWCGLDDLGWQYFWDRDRGAFLRTKDADTQFLIYFFDWIGKEVAAPAERTHPFVGTWVATTVAYPGADSAPAPKNEAKLVLKADGTGQFSRFSLKSAVTYTSDGTALTVSLPKPHNETLVMKADASFSTLTWVDFDEEENADVTISLERA